MVRFGKNQKINRKAQYKIKKTFIKKTTISICQISKMKTRRENSWTLSFKLGMNNSPGVNEEGCKIKETCSKPKLKKNWKQKATRVKYTGFKRKFCTRKRCWIRPSTINFSVTIWKFKIKHLKNKLLHKRLKSKPYENREINIIHKPRCKSSPRGLWYTPRHRLFSICKGHQIPTIPIFTAIMGPLTSIRPGKAKFRPRCRLWAYQHQLPRRDIIMARPIQATAPSTRWCSLSKTLNYRKYRHLIRLNSPIPSREHQAKPWQHQHRHKLKTKYSHTICQTGLHTAWAAQVSSTSKWLLHLLAVAPLSKPKIFNKRSENPKSFRNRWRSTKTKIRWCCLINRFNIKTGSFSNE